MDRQAAATLLGVPVREVRAVDDDVIETRDGALYEVPDGMVDHWVRTNPGKTPPRFHAVTVEEELADEEPAVDVDGDGVPDGTAKQILEWVGDDPVRAAKARDAEVAKGGSARQTLVAALEKLAD
jgi:hypothetical protein